MGAPWLTVVTVVKDDAAGLLRTGESVLAQDQHDFEWIVVDGSTPPLEPGANGALANPQFVYAWQRPEGVYSAMNHGLERATGDYILFLNAGDILASAAALTQLKVAISHDDPEWAYCDVRFVDSHGRAVVPAAWDYEEERKHLFSRGRFPPHQGTVVRASLLRSFGGFDESFKIAADYAAVLRLSQVHAGLYIPIVLAEFTVGGLSTTHWGRAAAEFHHARRTILHPSGKAALQEYWNTGLLWTKQALFNTVVRPLRGSMRGSSDTAERAK